MDREDVSQECRDCIIALLTNFKEHALIYLPLINAVFNQKNLRKDSKLKTVTDKLKECGDLETLETYDEVIRRRMVETNQQYSPSRQLESMGNTQQSKKAYIGIKLNNAIQPFSSEDIKNLFDVSNNFLKEDWEEWLTKTSNELLINSPSKVLKCCKSFSNVNPNISKDLFNVGFGMIWTQFNDNQRCTVIQNIEKTITNSTVPLSVHKAILNLAEFMEHDNQGLQLDITYMAKLAERCNAHAKALYYREFEFNFNPDESIESLISLYSNLGQPEAARGMLDYAKNILQTKVKETWLESLGKWEEALIGYTSENPTTQDEKLNNLKSKIRCYDALTKWEDVLAAADECQLSASEFGDIATYAARASIQLGQWDKLEKYTERINIRKDDVNYYDAIIAISKHHFPEARASIKKSRRYFENFLVGINRQTYQNNYDKLVKLQILSEMEEIIDFKELQHSLTGEQTIDGYNYELASTEDVEMKQRNSLLEIWADRIESAEKNISTWLDIISVRNLLFSNSEMLPVMIRLAEMAVNKGKMGEEICNRIFVSLEDEMNKVHQEKSSFKFLPSAEVYSQLSKETPIKDDTLSCQPLYKGKFEKFDFTQELSEHQYTLPHLFYLAKFEKMYMLDELNSEMIYDVIMDFFRSVDVKAPLRAIYYRKLGSWLAKDLTDESQRGFDKVLSLFKKSSESNDKDVRTWHLLALTNFKRIRQMNEKERGGEAENSSRSPLFLDMVHGAVKGFIKAISIGGSDYTESLQDTLKLLYLWFRYGDIPDIQKMVKDSFHEIDISSWLNVVPQLISQLQLSKEQILQNIIKLLEHIGSKYPQALIFKLMLLSVQPSVQGSKESARGTDNDKSRNTARGLIATIRLKWDTFVTQAHSISEEIKRVAMLQQEVWIEYMGEAIKRFREGKYSNVSVIMSGLHSKLLDEAPQSHSEILFYQKYSFDIREAGYYLEHYQNTYKDEDGNVASLAAAIHIYSRLIESMKEDMNSMKTISIKSVSSKLPMMKDTQVALPGMYDPKRPQIYIIGFYDVLKILNSQRKPRKIKIFGSDGKSYDFLLKGHEDLRQDERVMQTLGLMNRILRKHEKTEKKDLTIITYPVIPLSNNTGLLGWVQGCDTIQELVKEYRKSRNTEPDAEFRFMVRLCPNYVVATLAHKIEIYRYILENTTGEDLKKILWLKSQNAEVWLHRRTNYVCSLATMSIVGYLLGLGDRHLSNLMIQRISGKIVHIDFGDLFEVTMTRKDFPEKVPFRLTRLLTKAMEACGIEGNYRSTCRSVMEVIRENRDSLLDILESFATDPLLNWRMIGEENEINEGNLDAANNHHKPVLKQLNLDNDISKIKNSMESGAGRFEMEMRQKVADNLKPLQVDIFKRKAIDAVNRIKAKTLGNDFKNCSNLTPSDQVNMLIRQATADECIAPSYIGWNPFL